MTNHQEKSAFELVRLGYLIAGLSTLVFFPMEFFLRTPAWLIFIGLNFVLMVLYFLVWRLVRQSWKTPAALALCIASSGQIFIAVFFHFGPLLGLQTFFLIFAYLPFLLLSSRQRAGMYTLSSLNIALFVWSNFFLPEAGFPSFSVPVMRFSHLMSALTIVTIFIVLVIYFQICSRRREEELLDNVQNQELLFSLIGHDLRGPVGGLNEGLAFFESHCHTMPQQEQKDFLRSLRQTSENIFALLENLLLWTSRRQGRVPFHPLPHDWQDLVDAVLSLWQDQARAAEVIFKIDIPPHTIVTCDADMMSTVLRNLISNAIKYSPEKSTVHLRCFFKNLWFVCEVEDSGVGMDQESLAKLFSTKDRPQRPGLHGERGTGLGLRLVQEFVSQHGGRVSAKSELGKGSVFRFEIPQLQQ